MKKTVNTATWDEVSDFDNVVQPIIKLLRNNWTVDVAPKNYSEYKETFEGYDDMSDEKYILKFDGLLNTSASNYTLPTTLSMPQVAYSDVEQGRDPLETLVGAILSYGMSIGKRQEQTQPNCKDIYIDSIQTYLEWIASGKFDADTCKEYAKITLERFNNFVNK